MRKQLSLVLSTLFISIAYICDGAEPAARPAQLVENGATDYLIVTGTNGLYDRFAVSEFKEIMEKSAGVKFHSVGADSPEATNAKKRILIGDSPHVRKILGDELVDGLENLESIVTQRGDDIIIVGGGNHGTAYGVYSFLEKEIGYRWFTPERDGQLIPKRKSLTYSGKEHHERIAFPFLRTMYMLPYYNTQTPLFLYRNRGSINTRFTKKTKMKGLLDSDHPHLDNGHGFGLYITTDRTKNFYEWDTPKDYFKTNPDFFSMDKNGKRTNRLQLCFSNPELRKEFTKRIIERGKRMGGRGVLTLGANDVPGSFCFCPECQKQEEKYGCIGGPLYDYLIELCPIIEKELPDIQISTLAYRKKQSEFPPKNIKRMPNNWICDFAPVDDDMGQCLDGPRNLGTLVNLRDWNEIAKTITYWYYVCVETAPFGIVERFQRDMRIMKEYGVKGVGVCGMGPPGLYPLQEYILLRLMIDPYQDAWRLVREYTDFIYGPAAEDMRQYIQELEEVWLEPKKNIELYGPGKVIMNFTPERLVRWQKMFDDMGKKVEGLKRESKYLSLARWDLDQLCLDHYQQIRKAFPDWKTNLDDLIGRMRKVDLPPQYRLHNPKDRAENAYLVATAVKKPLPVPLDKLPNGQVTQIPQCGGSYPLEDPDAACGKAKTQPFRDGQMKEQGKKISYSVYDKAAKRTLKNGKLDVSTCEPGKYESYFITKTTIPRGGLIAFDNWWGVQDSLAQYYPEGDEFREFEIWASLKFVGPSFGIETKDNKDRMFCDRIFIVDRNAK